MNLGKSWAFIIALIAIIVIAAINFIKVEFPAPPYLTAIVSLATLYMGSRVANNGVKGRHFNKELYHCENGNANNQTIL